ncbi:tRNA 2-selenouridine(34) synthase MnmH [bacterium]|nr:tRNA 2-selenouridine(34) synthase MnmH [bacterium]MBT6528657.1 tRNA 2-selenouridine(34) synthase MnmH [bacterium]
MATIKLMIKIKLIHELIPLIENGIPVIDVRAPVEFAQGHIPGTLNVPLFSDKARKDVGIVYKQQGKQAAVMCGLSLVGPRVPELSSQLQRAAPQNKAILYCARGGMRSQSVAQLCNLLGITVYLVTGGYKAYRNFVLDQFEKNYKINVLAGKTGCNKTVAIEQLVDKKQAIDLEGLAKHRGSVFGGLQTTKQPTQQQFENELGLQLAQHGTEQKLWLEDESRKIGSIILPAHLWNQMRNAPITYLTTPRLERIANIIELYKDWTPDQFLTSLSILEKRLGPDRYKQLYDLGVAQEKELIVGLLLNYYDTKYEFGLKQRPQPIATHNNYQTFLTQTVYK